MYNKEITPVCGVYDRNGRFHTTQDEALKANYAEDVRAWERLVREKVVSNDYHGYYGYTHFIDNPATLRALADAHPMYKHKKNSHLKPRVICPPISPLQTSSFMNSL